MGTAGFLEPRRKKYPPTRAKKKSRIRSGTSLESDFLFPIRGAATVGVGSAVSSTGISSVINRIDLSEGEVGATSTEGGGATGSAGGGLASTAGAATGGGIVRSTGCGAAGGVIFNLNAPLAFGSAASGSGVGVGAGSGVGSGELGDDGAASGTAVGGTTGAGSMGLRLIFFLGNSSLILSQKLA